MMKTVEEIEKAITQLAPEQLRIFRAWYAQYDSNAWDEQIQRDAMSGRLDSLAEAAIADHKAGKSKKL